MVVCARRSRPRHRRVGADGDRLFRARWAATRLFDPARVLVCARSLRRRPPRQDRGVSRPRARVRERSTALSVCERRRGHQLIRCWSSAASALPGQLVHRRRQPHGDVRRAESVRDGRWFVRSRRRDDHRADLAAGAGDDSRSRSRGDAHRAISARRTSRSRSSKGIGAEGANYQALEFHGDGVGAFALEERLVICNLGVEMDAKAAIFPADSATEP